MVAQIGTNAGLIWHALNENGKLNVKDLRKVTKIKADKDIYAALGWLAKEGKLVFEKEEEDVFVRLY
ncbi:MAG: winged helix-turn-helix domain-containing protein [Bacteroidales bacterium]|jgi:hypothetical protein